ncbi:hypothetical protein KM043_000786 [Ampulex compressa]|nr:hypothetical protein KM043_000786 [Ampulex compressa]
MAEGYTASFVADLAHGSFAKYPGESRGARILGIPEVARTRIPRRLSLIPKRCANLADDVRSIKIVVGRACTGKSNGLRPWNHTLSPARGRVSPPLEIRRPPESEEWVSIRIFALAPRGQGPPNVSSGTTYGEPSRPEVVLPCAVYRPEIYAGTSSILAIREPVFSAQNGARDALSGDRPFARDDRLFPDGGRVSRARIQCDVFRLGRWYFDLRIHDRVQGF